jgi:WD40 repeat protein
MRKSVGLLVFGSAFVLMSAGSGAQQPLPIEIVPVVPHGASITALAISDDGTRALTGSDDKTASLWEIRSGRLIRSFNHGSEVTGVGFAPDGKRVLTAGKNGEMKLWDAASARTISTFAGHRESIYGKFAVAFSRDGSRLVSASSDNSIRVWDVPLGRLLRSINSSHLVYDSFLRKDTAQSMVAVWTSLSGERAVTAAGGTFDKDFSIKLWDTSSGVLIREMRHHKRPIKAIASSNDTSVIVSTSDDDTMVIWDGRTGRAVHIISHGRGIDHSDLAVSFDGKRVLSSDGEAVRIWDSGSGKLLTKVNVTKASNVAISRDGMIGVAANHLSSLVAFDIVSGAIITERSVAKSVEYTRLSFDGLSFTTAAIDDKIRRWDAISGRLDQTIDDKNYRTSYPGSGPNLVAVENAKAPQIKVFDVVSGQQIQSFSGTNIEGGVTISVDGKRVASGGEALDFWDVSSGRLIRSVRGGKDKFSAVQMSPDGNSVLTATNPFIGPNPIGRLELWDFSSGRLIRSFAGHRGGIHAVAFSQDGKRTISGNGNRLAYLWDLPTGKLLRTFEAHRSLILSVGLSANGSRAVTGSMDQTIKLWDVANGRLLRTFEGHTGWVSAVSISPDGRRVLSGSSDATTRLWNAETGELLATFVGMSTGEWLVITPEGFFNASEKRGALVSVVQGLNVWSVDQFYQSLYRPDLVREKLAGDPRGLVREAAAKLDLNKVLASGNAPTLTLVGLRDGERVTSQQINAALDITAREGGIGRVEWRINGVTVGIETPAAGQPLRLTRGLVLEEGENEVEVVAYNAQNLVASVPARATVTVPAAAGAPPRLFMLAVGLNEYEDKEIQLKFAVPDATALAEALGKAGRGVYESVQVTILKDAEVRRNNLDETFKKLATEVRPTDVFVFFIAGHGKTVDGRYHFIPQDIKLDGVESILKQGIAQEEWQRWFASIPARRSVLLFDTCESGSLTAEGFETRALARGAASDRLVQATGRTILTATSDTAEAFEGYRGHGLFTYNLLDALGAADSNGNGTVELPELAAYVHAQVTALSEKMFKNRQVPQVRITGNYPIAKAMRVLAEGPADIVIASKPTHTIGTSADLLVQPVNGARRVRKLDAKTPLTLVRNEGGWTLVAREGRPVGYVATRDLSPIQ